jgi:SAM-dependent methyltransferase
MLDACAQKHPDVKLKEGYAEELPYPDASFDVVTCYSFLDHLESTERFYTEAIRVLKPSGVFYFGLSPNRDFYIALIQSRQSELSAYLQNKVDLPLELKKAFDDGAYYEENFGIDKKDLLQCEPGKSILNGLSPMEEVIKLERLGSCQVKVNYEWAFQQNRHNADVVKTLINFLPFTKSCFKYFELTGLGKCSLTSN